MAQFFEPLCIIVVVDVTAPFYTGDDSSSYNDKSRVPMVVTISGFFL